METMAADKEKSKGKEKRNPHPCPKCPYIAGDSSNLNKHVRAIHDRERKFSCSECDHKFADKCNLDKHIATVHRKVKPYKCPHCDYTASTNQKMTKHIDAVHSRKVFSCEQCEFTSKGSWCLERHVKSVHLNIFDFVCDVVDCDYKTNRRPDLKEHVNCVHLKVTYPCDKCDFKALWLKKLRLHVKEVHENVRGNKCGHCEYETFDKSTLTTHVRRVHLKLTNFVCDKCDYKCYDKTSFESHTKRMHEGEDNLECHFCKRKDFGSKIDMTRHMASSHFATMTREGNNFERGDQKEELVCDLCGKGESMKTSLVKHKYRHKKEMRREGEVEGQEGDVVCDICNEVGFTKLRLKWHIKVKHKGVKRNPVCTICGMGGFKSPYRLKQHEMTHKADRKRKERKRDTLESEEVVFRMDVERGTVKLEEYNDDEKEEVVNGGEYFEMVEESPSKENVVCKQEEEEVAGINEDDFFTL